MEIRVMESGRAFAEAFEAGEVPLGLGRWAVRLSEDHPAREEGYGWHAMVTRRDGRARAVPVGRFCATLDEARAWLEGCE